MIPKEDLLAGMQRECDVCCHLFTKIPEGGLSYRPSEGQRNMLELLQYLSIVGLAMSKSMVTGDWDEYAKVSAGSEDLTAAEFPAAMARQKDALAELLGGLTDDQFCEGKAPMPWGEEFPLGRGLMEMPYACLVAYRMQLFLYIKAAGNLEIGTANCWGGVDMPSSG